MKVSNASSAISMMDRDQSKNYRCSYQADVISVTHLL